MVKDDITTLERLLEQERVALTDGDFDVLQRLGPDKERLLQLLPQLHGTPARMQAIANQIHRNQALLNAAMRGVKAAKMKILGRKDGDAGSIIYGRNGEVSHMKSGGKGLSQKL